MSLLAICENSYQAVLTSINGDFSLPEVESVNPLLPTISFQQLAMMPKPIPIWDLGIHDADTHICLKNNFSSSDDLFHFTVMHGDTFFSTFPACRHKLVFNTRLEVIVHIYQEHLAHFSKAYHCLTCNREFGKIHQARRHVKTENDGKVHKCRKCDHTAKRKDAIAVHEKTVHRFFGKENN